MIIGARGRVFISLPSAGKDHIYFNSTSIRTWPLYLSISYGLYLLYPLDYIVRSRRVQVLPVRTISFGAARPKPGRAHTSFGLYRRGATACPVSAQGQAVPAPWNASSAALYCYRVQQAAAQGGGGKGEVQPGIWIVRSYRPHPRRRVRSSRVESTRPQSEIQSKTQSEVQSSNTLRCCDPLPALLAGAAGVVCPTAGSRTGRA